MTLISRQINIATNLLNNPQTYKVKDLSARYKVSIRTLRNDLKKIAEWINKQPGCKYNSKPGKGIWISFASDFNRTSAINSLQSFSSEEVISQYLSPTQRKWKILTSLVFAEGFITGKTMTKMLGVSANTFLADINNAKTEAQRFNLLLEGKNYYGYFLTGDEINIRALMEYILQKQIDRYSFGANNLIDLISKISTSSAGNTNLPKNINKLINYVSLILCDILNLKKAFNTGMDLSIAKSMINRLTIIILENHRHRFLNLSGYGKRLNQTQKHYAQIYKFVSEIFDIRPTKDEEKYFIFGVKVLEKDVETNKAVKEIISYVSQKMVLPLENDLQLQDSLTQHLISELNSNFQHFNDYTPFTAEVKSRFGTLFETVKAALDKYISKSPLINSDTFVTLVSLHFLVSISDLQKVPQVSALYVCSTGLGATKLLKKVIQSRIPYITSAGFASAINYRTKIYETKPDLVISIFPLKKIASTKIIQVNPIPNEQDMLKVEREVSFLLKQNAVKNDNDLRNVIKEEQSINNVEKILSLSIEAYINVSEYLGDRISKKYEKAFMIHVQLATERIYFDKQYDSKPTDKQINKFSKSDISRLHKIYLDLGLHININEIIAILRYTLLK